MNVYLVQHAEASPKEADPDQALSEKGIEDITNMAGFLEARAGIRIRSILHGPKIRAKQSAEILARALKPDQGIMETDGLTPLDDPQVWMSRIGEMDEDTMLVGHMPHMGKLASGLLCRDTTKPVVAFQRGAIVCLKREDRITWSLGWMIVPSILIKERQRP